jgi:acetylornithine/succinyldiaminopimelate/putrescine aminotransferase
VSSNTAAIIVEPIQGEGGVWPMSTAMAEALAAVCAETGTLLIADEVQCGLGRTGHPFYSAVLGLKPDLMALGKALGAGVPVGAALVSQPVASAVAFGDHGSTYGGNLLACRAALVFLDELENGLLARVAEAGARLEAGLRALASTHTTIRDIRGAGLMWGMEVAPGIAPQMVPAALKRGLIINCTAGTVIRLLPPLTISDADLDEALAKLGAVFEDVA